MGLLVGSRKKEIHRIYVALDATDETIQEAVSAGADMLLTHHPLIFKGIKNVNAEDFIGRRVIELVRHDMAYYAMHTNFDISGMADLAAERMQLTDTRVLQVTGFSGEVPEKLKKGGAGGLTCPEGKIDPETAAAIGIGKVGNLPREMTLKKCAEYVKQVFDVDMVRVFGNLDGTAPEERTSPAVRTVFRAAICPGSGKSVINDALKAGAQVLITGDIDHHEGIDAVARGMAVIDAGHYGLEKIFIPYMKQYLEERLPEVEVIAREPKQPFCYL